VSTDELHDELRTVARQVLGHGDPDLAQLADLGWLGLEVPEALDGAGATFAAAAVVLEEMGRATTAGPDFATAVLGAGVLDLVEAGSGRDDLLRLVATGGCRLAVALDGQTDFVADAAQAHRLLLVARDPGGDAFVVPVRPGDPGIRVEPDPCSTPPATLAASRSRPGGRSRGRGGGSRAIPTPPSSACGTGLRWRWPATAWV
jgi:alkylation response protein AidB-like acyl-CoA dehydrogenase